MKTQKADITDRTFKFAVRIIKLCRVLDRKAGTNRTLASQLLRSGTSMGANIEEGQAGQSRADVLSKLSIACKEARETNYWLRLLVASELSTSFFMMVVTICNNTWRNWSYGAAPAIILMGRVDDSWIWED